MALRLRPPEASDGDPDALSLHSNDRLTPEERAVTYATIRVTEPRLSARLLAASTRRRLPA